MSTHAHPDTPDGWADSVADWAEDHAHELRYLTGQTDRVNHRAPVLTNTPATDSRPWVTTQQLHPALTVELILSRLHVNTSTGRAYWIASDFLKRTDLVGREAGCVRGRDHKARWVIKLNQMHYGRSQIVFAVANGRWPLLQVDHRNRVGLDDRADNLREATAVQNNWNRTPKVRSDGLPTGVKQRSPGCFEARMSFGALTKVIGYFATPDLASAAYQSARKERYGEFA